MTSNTHAWGPSERQSQGVALGRKTYMNVGHVEAGEKTAARYTIVACWGTLIMSFPQQATDRKW